jgi:hypothetical protein
MGSVTTSQAMSRSVRRWLMPSSLGPSSRRRWAASAGSRPVGESVVGMWGVTLRCKEGRSGVTVIPRAGVSSPEGAQCAASHPPS